MPIFAGLSGVYGPANPGAQMMDSRYEGPRIAVTGQILDGADTPATDAMVEIWQADADGRMPGPDHPAGFTGWGRQAIDPETGQFTFQTIKPGPILWQGERMQAPHILIWIVARGINLALTTRLYFPDEDNTQDPVFQSAGARASTLVATRVPKGYNLDIHLQGERETVFFHV